MGEAGQRDSSDSSTGLLSGEAWGELAGVITAGASFKPKDMDRAQTRTGAGVGKEELSVAGAAAAAESTESIDKMAGTAADANDEANSQRQTPPLWERQPQSIIAEQFESEDIKEKNANAEMR